MAVILGDIHGSFKRLIDFRDCNLIQVGDFGLGFGSFRDDEKSLDYFNVPLAARKIHVYAIRGNHDNPEYWDGRYKDRWSNIHLVPEYTVLEIEKFKVLFLGGAISIDRKLRIEGKSYWKDERFNYDEDKLNAVLKEAGNIDIVISHSAPEFCFPRGYNLSVENYAFGDKELKGDIAMERAELARAYEVIKPHKLMGWFYGHYHDDHDEVIEGVRFRLLGIGEDIKI